MRQLALGQFAPDWLFFTALILHISILYQAAGSSNSVLLLIMNVYVCMGLHVPGFLKANSAGYLYHTVTMAHFIFWS